MPASTVPPSVVAHRGASGHLAEHTLAAYQLALDQGADGLECDVRLTRDGHLVCVHDRRVDRTASGRGVVSATDLATLAALDYGGWHDEWDSADDLVHERVGRRQRGPLTLADLLGLVTDCPRLVRLFVETKHPVRYGGLVESKVVALLARHGLARPATKAASPVVVMSFSRLALRRVRADAPLLPTVLLLHRLAPVADGRLPHYADLAGPDVRTLRQDPGFVGRTAERGHQTYCWTVDDPADVDFCVRAGVHHIATNRPATTLARLRRT